MSRPSVSPRPLRALLLAVVAMSMLAIPSAGASPDSAASEAATSGAAGATAPAALNDNGPFSAAATGSLLTLDVPALSPALLPETTVDLAHSEAQAASDQDFDAAREGGQRSYAVAGTTGDSALLGAPLDLQTTTASAPESEAHEDILIPVPDNPLLDLEVIRTSAQASYVSDVECVSADTPLSRADQSLADLALVPLGEGQSVIALDTDPTDGTANTEAETSLVSIAGPGADQRAVQARATTDITSADVLNGLGGDASALAVTVVQAPDLTAQASGLPGGASVTGQRPVVSISLQGEPLITLDESNPTVDATVTDLVLSDLIDLGDDSLLSDLLTDLGLGALIPVAAPIEAGVKQALAELQPVVRLSLPYEESVAADGTSASVTAALLRIEILPPEASGATEAITDVVSQILAALGLDVTAPLVFAELGPLSASVQAPAGGIDCGGPSDNPLRELNKHASATEVAPGGTFDYTISVPNRGPCALTDVVVTDTITGPGFEVVGTEPAAQVNGGTVTFDVGDLAVNETRDLIIHVRVAADAPDGATFDDHVVATGKCDGRDVTEDDDVIDTPTVRDDFEGPCSVQFSNKDASHEQVTPGETFSYYVHAYNTGAEPCTDVVITDTLDDRVAFVSCTGGCDHDGQKVTWTVDSIAGGSSATLAVVVQVAEDATGTLANAAIIDPGNADPKTVTSTGPVIGDRSIPKDPAPAARGGAPLRGPLPKTGTAVPMGLAALLGASALALFALRRRTASA